MAGGVIYMSLTRTMEAASSEEIIPRDDFNIFGYLLVEDVVNT